MRFVAFVLFWVGVFAVVREWLYSRKHGLAITRAEKVYLALTFPVIFLAGGALDWMWPTGRTAAAISVTAMGVTFNAWAIKRRMQR